MKKSKFLRSKNLLKSLKGERVKGYNSNFSSILPIFKSSALASFRAFTLIELIVTISIIAVLSVISVPLFVVKNADAKLAEGYALLGAIMNAQNAYYQQYGTFLWGANSSHGLSGWTSKEDVLGISAFNNRYFTYFSVDTKGFGSNAKLVSPKVASSKCGTLTVEMNVGAHGEIGYKK